MRVGRVPTGKVGFLAVLGFDARLVVERGAVFFGSTSERRFQHRIRIHEIGTFDTVVPDGTRSILHHRLASRTTRTCPVNGRRQGAPRRACSEVPTH